MSISRPSLKLSKSTGFIPKKVSSSSTGETVCCQFSPLDFVNFLPWAYNKMSCGKATSINVEKCYDARQLNLTTKSLKVLSNRSSASELSESNTAVNQTQIDAVYNASEQLMQLKFLNNRFLSREIFQILSLIVQFHVALTSIIINKGLDQYIIYELSKILSKSNITELCLDGAFCEEGNYAILLSRPSHLQYLSLARCKINDAIVIAIAEKLINPAPASETLCVLNLSSNFITNVGANALADALRYNRRICYLNLANNLIGDSGTESILNVLVPFPLTVEEILEMKSKRFIFAKLKQKRVHKYLAMFYEGIQEQRLIRKPVIVGAKKPARMEPALSFTAILNSLDVYSPISHAYLEEMSLKLVEKIYGTFNHPLSKRWVVEGWLHCRGNRTLAYLNLAYNKLSYHILQKVNGVLVEQQNQQNVGLGPGLVNIVLEGNLLPTDCKELTEINNILDSGLLLKSAQSLPLPKHVANKQKSAKSRNGLRDTE